MKLLVIGCRAARARAGLEAGADARAGVQKVYVAPGNAGTARENGFENVARCIDDSAELIDFARRKSDSR